MSTMGHLQRTTATAVTAVTALTRSPLLGSLDPDDLAAVLGVSRGTQRCRGDRLLNAGEDAAVVVLSGAAAVRVLTDDGDLHISALLGPGDGHGLTAALGHLDVSVEIQAVATTEALVVPGPQLRRLVDTSPNFARACLRALAAQHADERREALRFAGSSTTERVHVRLLDLAERWGRRDGNEVEVTVPLTQEELASWARSSRESTAKVLHQLRTAGIVQTGRRELRIIDLAGLRARQRNGHPDHTVQALLRSIG